MGAEAQLCFCGATMPKGNLRIQRSDLSEHHLTVHASGIVIVGTRTLILILPLVTWLPTLRYLNRDNMSAGDVDHISFASRNIHASIKKGPNIWYVFMQVSFVLLFFLVIT